MHEMSYVVRFVNQALAIAEERHAQKVLSLSLDIGDMTGIEDHYLIKYYETASKGTILEGSSLDITHTPIEALCDDCGTSYHPDKEHDYLCPSCKSGMCHITKGRGVQIRQVKMITPDDRS